MRAIDSQTGLDATAGATLTISGDNYYEVVSLPEEADDRTVAGAWERPGLYDVTISKAGYQSWSNSGILVKSRDELCGSTVDTVHLDALLLPETL